MAAYGELADEHRHQLELHLAGCDDCRQEQARLLAMKTLADCWPMVEPSPNLVARSRARLDDALDSLPPLSWYQRMAQWLNRTAGSLQAAPAAAVLLLVAGIGMGSLGGYQLSERHNQRLKERLAEAQAASVPVVASDSQPGDGGAGAQIASVSRIVRQPNSEQVEVSYNQVEPRELRGSLDDPQIRQLLMLASQNAASQNVRNDSIALLADECRAGHACRQSDTEGSGVREALMVALRYDRSAGVRSKALQGLEPFVEEDMQVRDAVLEALMNDPDARVRSQAIRILQPVEADTSVRQVLSTVAMSDQNSQIRNTSRMVLRRVSEVQ
jgi:anti-sigma factor RsiW